MNLLNMQPYVNMLNTQPFQYRTYDTGAFNTRGVYIEGVANPLQNALGNFQPVKQEAKFVPEGERAENLYIVYTTVRLKTADELTKTRADEVLFRNKWWKVITPRNWIDNGFNKALIIDVRKLYAGP